MPETPVHPWRLCPAGEHYRKPSKVKPYTKKNGTFVRGHSRQNTCVENPSGKDQLYPEEIQEIAKKYFDQFKNNSLHLLSEYKEAGNAFDHLIQGWVKYWNDILMPSEPLDPKIIKALIASESGFDIKAWNKLKGKARARGLMQVRDDSVRFLSDDFNEFQDHFLNLNSDDMLDSNLSICAGIKWLFRKKELSERKAKNSISWREGVAAFKGVKPDSKLMKKFDRCYKELQGLK